MTVYTVCIKQSLTDAPIVDVDLPAGMKTEQQVQTCYAASLCYPSLQVQSYSSRKAFAFEGYLLCPSLPIYFISVLSSREGA